MIYTIKKIAGLALPAVIITLAAAVTPVGALAADTPPAAGLEAAPAPQVVFPQTTYAFDPVMEGTEIKHDFIIENRGPGVLEIKKVQPD